MHEKPEEALIQHYTVCMNKALQERSFDVIDGAANTNGVQSDASGHSEDSAVPGSDELHQVTDHESCLTHSPLKCKPV